ncbi:MAG: phosphoribosylanthranilate isomerase [Brotaphodocola sp.]
MTKIKLCGLTRPCDIETANELIPDYIGFVFAPKSRRYTSPEQAASLRKLLHPSIQAAGVFVRETPERVANLLNQGIIDVAQLHGGEDETYICRLRALTDRPIVKAFRIDHVQDIQKAETSSADYVLLDCGNGGTGTTFDWELAQLMKRPYFLAGGLNVKNAAEAVKKLKPFAVDVSSGIETNGIKDRDKMCAFVRAVRQI